MYMCGPPVLVSQHDFSARHVHGGSWDTTDEQTRSYIHMPCWFMCCGSPIQSLAHALSNSYYYLIPESC
jgi:hypothetical protein